jgi:uncharacterized SAM-binding protein YcdF (DUF218 family)
MAVGERMEGRNAATAVSRRRGGFRAGVLAGVAGVALLAWLINTFDAVDVLVRPLLVADAKGSADAIVVPGAGVIGSTCVPNLSAMRRTMMAVRLYRQGRAPLVVFSGGKPEDSPCTVSEVMASFAEQLGLPPDAALVETRSRSTWQNAVMTRALLEPRGVRKVIVATDALHAVRCLGVFRKAGFEAESVSVPVMQSVTSNVGMLRMAAHEYLGLIYYRLRGYT